MCQVVTVSMWRVVTTNAQSLLCLLQCWASIACDYSTLFWNQAYHAKEMASPRSFYHGGCFFPSCVSHEIVSITHSMTEQTGWAYSWSLLRLSSPSLNYNKTTAKDMQRCTTVWKPSPNSALNSRLLWITWEKRAHVSVMWSRGVRVDSEVDTERRKRRLLSYSKEIPCSISKSFHCAAVKSSINRGFAVKKGDFSQLRFLVPFSSTTLELMRMSKQVLVSTDAPSPCPPVH